MIEVPPDKEFDHPGSVLYFKVDRHRCGIRRPEGHAASTFATRRTSSRRCRIMSCGWRSFETERATRSH